MTTTTALTVLPVQRVPLDDLRATLDGRVQEAHDPGYDALVQAWNLSVPMRPAAVVEPTCTDDVVRTVRFAAQHGLTVGVQATGHGAVSSLAGHVLVATRRLDEVVVHPEQRWARVGAGVKWAALVAAAAPYGLAGVSGSSTDVGIVGYTTGGGVGPLARTHGIASDKVRAIEVVTGDGEFRRVTPDEHPDLFFALRGGKGAGGIITALEIDLVELPTFYGGACFFDAADAPAVLRAWRAWSDELPEAGTTSFAVFQLPAMPGVPEPLAGRTTLSVRFLWTGDHEEGERRLAQVRRAAEPILDGVAVLPYSAVDAVHTDPVDPMPVYEASMLLTELPEEALAALLDRCGAGSGSPHVLLEVRQLGGAYAREGAAPSAFCHRDARYSVLAVGLAGTPGASEHADELFDALSRWDTGGVWPNFAPPHDPTSAARAYDAETLERLRDVVATYDPQGVCAGGGFARR